MRGEKIPRRRIVGTGHGGKGEIDRLTSGCSYAGRRGDLPATSNVPRSGRLRSQKSFAPKLLCRTSLPQARLRWTREAPFRQSFLRSAVLTLLIFGPR